MKKRMVNSIKFIGYLFLFVILLILWMTIIIPVGHYIITGKSMSDYTADIDLKMHEILI